MSLKDDGGHAFPCSSFNGMTLRDYFAAQVMVGFGTWSPMQWPLGVVAKYEKEKVLQARAELAYAQADAMLKARAQ